MDDENEAVVYINDNIENTTAFVMDMRENKMEQDCTPLNGSTKLFEYRYVLCTFVTKNISKVLYRFAVGEGEVYARARPCTCLPCLEKDWSNCENLEYAGYFNLYRMQKLGMRLPKARYVASEVPLPEQYRVHEILGRRAFQGQLQYLVSWVV